MDQQAIEQKYAKKSLPWLLGELYLKKQKREELEREMFALQRAIAQQQYDTCIVPRRKMF